MAEVALEHRSVPRGSSGGILVHGILRGGAAREQTRGIGDDVARVEAADLAVDGGAVHPRLARAGFEVEDEGRGGDKDKAAASERATDVRGCMHKGAVLGCMRGGV